MQQLRDTEASAQALLQNFPYDWEDPDFVPVLLPELC